MAVELDINICDSKLTVFGFTNLIKYNKTFKSDLKLRKLIGNNIIEERKIIKRKKNYIWKN